MSIAMLPPPSFPNDIGKPYAATIAWHGLTILVENERYSMRRQHGAPPGERWESEMPDHYGEVHGTIGADGDPIDVFVGRDESADTVYVVAIAKPDGTFDEVKCMLGYPSKEAALDALSKAYDDSLRILRVSAWTVADFVRRASKGVVRGDWRHGRGTRQEGGGSAAEPMAKSSPPGDGWSTIPGGHHNGQRRARLSGGYDYWYPSAPSRTTPTHLTDDGSSTWYHGTKAPIEGGRLRGDKTGMVYLAQDPEVSRYYGPNISRHTVHSTKVLDLGDDPYDTRKLVRVLRSGGHEDVADRVEESTAQRDDDVQTNGIFAMLRDPAVVTALLHEGYDGVHFADDHDEHWKPRVLAVLAGAVSAPKAKTKTVSEFEDVGRLRAKRTEMTKAVPIVMLKASQVIALEMLLARDRRAGADQLHMFGPPTREQGLVAKRVKVAGYHRKGAWVPAHYETRLVRPGDAAEQPEPEAPAPVRGDMGPLFAPAAVESSTPEPAAAQAPDPEPPAEPWQQERKTTLWFERKAEVPAMGDFVNTKDGPREVTHIKVEFVPSDADSLGAPGGMDKGYAARVTLAPVTADARKTHVDKAAALLSAADRRNAVNDALVAVGRHHVGEAIPTSLAPAGTSYVLVDERLPQLKEELLHADDGSWWRLHNSSSYDDWRDSALQLDAEGAAIAKKAVDDLAITGTARSVAADVDAKRSAELARLREAKTAQQAAKDAALQRQFETAPAAVEEMRDWFPETDPHFENGRWSLAALPELQDMIGWTREGDRMVAPLYGTQGPYDGVAAHPGGMSYNAINGRIPQSGLTGTVVRHLVKKREEAARRAAEKADEAARAVAVETLKTERAENMAAWEARLQPWVERLNQERPDLDARYHEPSQGRPATVSFGPAVSEHALIHAPAAANQFFGVNKDVAGRATIRVNDPNQVDRHPVTKEWRRWSAVGANQAAMDAAMNALLAHKALPPSPAPAASAPARPAAKPQPPPPAAADDFAGSYGTGGSVRVARSGANWHISGNTFAIKDDLKRHGARWDPDSKGWRIAHEAAVRAGEGLRRTLHAAPAYAPMRKAVINLGRLREMLLARRVSQADLEAAGQGSLEVVLDEGRGTGEVVPMGLPYVKVHDAHPG